MRNILLVLIVALTLSSTSAWTLELTKVGMLGAGVVAGSIWHEIGHASATLSTGASVGNIQWNYCYSKNITSVEQFRFIKLGGYIFQNIATEVILQNKNWHHNDLALGWMGVGLLMDISNPIYYYIFGQTDNDLGQYALKGGNPAIPAILMLSYAGYSLYRISHNTTIPKYLSQNILEIKF